MTVHADSARRFSSRDALMVGGGVLLALLVLLAWTKWHAADATAAATTEGAPASKAAASPNEVTVAHDVLATAGIETASVTSGPAVARLLVTGTIEPNQEHLQQVTPLVGGRVEQVAVALGDPVQTGAVLVTISSPQIAEMRGNLRAAEAKLAQTEATLARTKRLVELGAGAGKDLVSAEAEQTTAQAQVAQLRQSLRALGAEGVEDSSLITIRAPASGRIIERAVNPGAWIELGKPVVTIANLSTVWVIVSVPEARLNLARIGAPVEIRAPTLQKSRAGRVAYIDAQLNQDTRSARVRVDIPNPGEALKIGMFVEVLLQGAPEPGVSHVMVPDQAVQRIGERTIVFTPGDKPEDFDVRDVELGDRVGDLRVVLKGVSVGERVVIKGGFVLKSQLLKGQFGDDDEAKPARK